MKWYSDFIDIEIYITCMKNSFFCSVKSKTNLLRISKDFWALSTKLSLKNDLADEKVSPIC